MKCSKCGSEIIQGQSVCPVCGEPVMSNTVDNSQSQSDMVADNSSVQPENNNVGVDQTNIDTSTVNAETQVESTPIVETSPVSEDISKENVSTPEVNASVNDLQNENTVSTSNFSFGPETTTFMNQQNTSVGEPTPNVEPSSPVEPTPNVADNSSVNSSGTKSNKKTFVIIGIVVAILIAAILAFVLLFKRQTSPKSVFARAIDNVADATLSTVKHDNKKVYEKASLSFNVKTPDESLNEIADIINKFTLSMDTTIDYDNKILSYNLLTNYGGKKLIAGDVYGENNIIYLHSADLYDKYIKIPMEFSDLLENNSANMQAYEDIVNEFKEALKNSLKDDYFKTSKEKITVNGQEVSATKNELVITKDNLKTIKNDCLTTLKNSSKFVSAVSKLSNQDENSVKETIDEALKNDEGLDEIVSGNYSISIYTKGAKAEFAKISFADKDNNSVDIVRINDNSYEIVVTYGSISYKLNFDITNNNDSKNYVLKFNNLGYNIEIKMDLEISYDKDVVKPNISNAVDVDSISEAELTAALEKLQSNPAFVQLITDLQNIKSDEALSLFDGLDL